MVCLGKARLRPENDIDIAFKSYAKPLGAERGDREMAMTITGP